MHVELMIVQYRIHVQVHNQADFDWPVINRRGFNWTFERWASLFNCPQGFKVVYQ